MSYSVPAPLFTTAKASGVVFMLLFAVTVLVFPFVIWHSLKMFDGYMAECRSQGHNEGWCYVEAQKYTGYRR